jgi:hypothetical protein
MPLKIEQLEKDGPIQFPMVMGAIVPVVDLEANKAWRDCIRGMAFGLNAIRIHRVTGETNGIVAGKAFGDPGGDDRADRRRFPPSSLWWRR